MYGTEEGSTWPETQSQTEGGPCAIGLRELLDDFIELFSLVETSVALWSSSIPGSTFSFLGFFILDCLCFFIF